MSAAPSRRPGRPRILKKPQRLNTVVPATTRTKLRLIGKKRGTPGFGRTITYLADAEIERMKNEG